MAKKKVVKRRKKIAPKSIGLAPADTGAPADSEVARLTEQVQSDGGTVLTAYREPIGGTTVLLAALPIDRVEPTPFQRDPSEPHVKRLMDVIEKLGRFLDPIIAIREHDAYWTPNGNHRLQALGSSGRRPSSLCSCRIRRWRSRSWRSIPRRRTTSRRSRSKRSAWRGRWPKRAGSGSNASSPSSSTSPRS